MTTQTNPYTVTLARSDADIRAAQNLRYSVFVEELGGDGPMVDHADRLERDAFDAHADHLILWYQDAVVGAYRLLRDDAVPPGERFYGEAEYDLAPLHGSGRKLLELGRSCLHRDHRGGTALFQMWQGLARYVAEHGIEILFGVASFHGIDVAALAGPLSLLHHRHLAPEPLRVRSRVYQPMDLIAEADLDRRAAMLQMPALIKAYLRLGGTIGDGAFIDHAFNTTDVCLIVDTARLNPAQSAHYTRPAP